MTDTEMAIRVIERCVRERDRFRRALMSISNINNGPDRASGEYRCQEAAEIATKALAQE